MKSIWGDEVTMPSHRKRDEQPCIYSNKGWNCPHVGIPQWSEIVWTDQYRRPGKLSNMKVDIDGNLKNFSGLMLKEDNSGNLVCTGFYAKGNWCKSELDRKRFIELEHWWIKNIQNGLSGKSTWQQRFRISIAMLNQFESKRQQEKNEKEKAKENRYSGSCTAWCKVWMLMETRW